MAGYISETMQCLACEHTYFDTLERDKRDETYDCPSCGAHESKRTFSVPHVSTPKTSASMLDGHTGNRFAHIKTAEELKKAKRKARAKGDLKGAKEVQKEIIKHKASRAKK